MRIYLHLTEGICNSTISVNAEGWEKRERKSQKQKNEKPKQDNNKTEKSFRIFAYQIRCSIKQNKSPFKLGEWPPFNREIKLLLYLVYKLMSSLGNYIAV
jgi:hypothetical protein